MTAPKAGKWPKHTKPRTIYLYVDACVLIQVRNIAHEMAPPRQKSACRGDIASSGLARPALAAPLLPCHALAFNWPMSLFVQAAALSLIDPLAAHPSRSARQTPAASWNGWCICFTNRPPARCAPTACRVDDGK